MDYNPQNKIELKKKKRFLHKILALQWVWEDGVSISCLFGLGFFFSLSRGYSVILDGIMLCTVYKFWHATCNSHHFPIKASIPHLENDQCLC